MRDFITRDDYIDAVELYIELYMPYSTEEIIDFYNWANESNFLDMCDQPYNDISLMPGFEYVTFLDYLYDYVMYGKY